MNTTPHLRAETLVNDRWRLTPARMAERLTLGRFERFQHIQYLDRRIAEGIARGGARIIISMPPRHGKSWLTSLYTPAWFLSLWPDRNVILASYEATFASTWGRSVRNFLHENQAALGTRLAEDSQAADKWNTVQGGGMITAGIGGPITGRGGHLIIIDDPIKNHEEAASELIRQKHIDWFNSTLYTRAEPAASIVLLMTRWHERDLAGYLINEHHDNWLEIRLPALAEDDDPLGRAHGEALCPERYSADALTQIQSAIGPHMWAALYQQRPAPIEGNLFKAEMFEFAEMPEAFDYTFIQADTAYKDKQENDFTVFAAFGVKGDDLFVIDVLRDRIKSADTIWKNFFNLCNQKSCEIFIRNFPINPNDPAQIFQLDILAAFAEYESNQTSRRVRESTFSAMISSGKFNSTKSMLGLDQLVVNGEPKVGIYVANHEELKIVEWAMKAFIRYGSYHRTLEECERLGIKNKSGEPFNRPALLTLLTNMRYIGKWILNSDNQGKNQKQLLPYDRYQEVSLPHGQVIDLELWETVQATVRRLAGNKDKNTKIKRIFLLSGILKHEDDNSPFHGTGATGRLGRKNYYFNTKHKLRISAELVEEEAKKIVAQVIRDSAPFRDAIKRKAVGNETMKYFLESQQRCIRAEEEGLENEKRSIDRRFDDLITTAKSEELSFYREEYKRELNRIAQSLDSKAKALESLELQRRQLAEDRVDQRELVDQAKETQDRIQDQDPVALKNAYREMFETISVSPCPTEGTIKLNFTLRGTSSSNITKEEKTSLANKMVGPAGLEPATKRL